MLPPLPVSVLLFVMCALPQDAHSQLHRKRFFKEMVTDTAAKEKQNQNQIVPPDMSIPGTHKSCMMIYKMFQKICGAALMNATNQDDKCLKIKKNYDKRCRPTSAPVATTPPPTTQATTIAPQVNGTASEDNSKGKNKNEKKEGDEENEETEEEGEEKRKRTAQRKKRFLSIK